MFDRTEQSSKGSVLKSIREQTTPRKARISHFVTISRPTADGAIPSLLLRNLVSNQLGNDCRRQVKWSALFTL